MPAFAFEFSLQGRDQGRIEGDQVQPGDDGLGVVLRGRDAAATDEGDLVADACLDQCPCLLGYSSWYCDGYDDCYDSYCECAGE